MPVYKKGSKSDYGNYRPISIISVISKVFEVILCRQLSDFFVSNLQISQFRFRANRSTIDAGITLLMRCSDGLEKGLKVGGRLYDLTKAFDTVSHKVLLEKLAYYGLSNVSLNLMKSYLSDRHQAVMLNGVMSSFRLVEHGVPQGSVLGPLLFIIYVNDLPSVIEDECTESCIFADDVASSVVSPNYFDLRLGLSSVSKTIQDWCNANSLSLNEGKTIEIIFTSSRIKPTQNDPVKFLGIYLEPGLVSPVQDRCQETLQEA